ncbi:MAG: 2-dehydropantoate 2-reductase N-terminal domain-containing protein, partial [Chloroflexota bacterium]
MKILVYGSGAIGGYVGGSLALAGHTVTFIARPAQAEAINAHGLTIRHNHESRVSSHVSAVTSPAEAFSANIQYDCIVFALKSFDTDAAIADLRTASPAPPPILCLQNGVDNEP